MKQRLIILAILSCCAVAFSEKPTDLVLKLQKEYKGRIKIGSANDTTLKVEDEKVEALKFHTYQDERDDLNYRIRVTVELEDKNDKTYFAQIMKPQPSHQMEYTGESNWEFHIPHGNMKRPKITAYAIQYGFIQDKKFIPVAEELDDVDAAEEITERTKTRTEIILGDYGYTYRE